MPTRAFKMQLNPGQIATYRKRHDEIWPALVDALHDAGITDYRIFVDEATHTLFAVMTHHASHTLDALPSLPVMQQWWVHMADIMSAGPDHAPIVTDLVPVFTLDAPPSATLPSSAAAMTKAKTPSTAATTVAKAAKAATAATAATAAPSVDPSAAAPDRDHRR